MTQVETHRLESPVRGGAYTLSRSALAILVDIAFPGPDDSEPTPHHGGPVIRPGERVFLNPQPEPPGRAIIDLVTQPEPERWGPRPEPWRWMAVTRALISRAIDRFETAGIIIVGGDVENAVQATRSSINQLVDDMCGTPPRKKPFPGPWGPVLDSELHPVNLLVAAAQFHNAAQALEGHPLEGVLEHAANRLFETGTRRL